MNGQTVVTEPAHISLDNDVLPLETNRGLMPVGTPVLYPYTMIVLVYSVHNYTLSNGTLVNYTSKTSGAMIYNDMALTCAHGVYSLEYNHYASSVKIYPAYNSVGAPNGTGYCYTVGTRYTPYLYDCGINVNTDYDWTVLITNTSFATNWFGYSYTNGTINSKEVKSAGYPIDYSAEYRMYKTSGTMTSSSDYRFHSTLTCYGGQSGSGVFDNNYVIWGEMQSYDSSHKGYGCRITGAMYAVFNSLQN